MHAQVVPEAQREQMFGTYRAALAKVRAGKGARQRAAAATGFRVRLGVFRV